MTLGQLWSIIRGRKTNFRWMNASWTYYPDGDPMGKPVKFFDENIEPEAKCRNCEYFDGGGLQEDGTPVQDHGDCHNRRSPYFTTSGGNTCKQFWPCSTRWPDCDHD